MSNDHKDFDDDEFYDEIGEDPWDDDGFDDDEFDSHQDDAVSDNHGKEKSKKSDFLNKVIIGAGVVIGVVVVMSQLGGGGSNNQPANTPPVQTPQMEEAAAQPEPAAAIPADPAPTAVATAGTNTAPPAITAAPDISTTQENTRSSFLSDPDSLQDLDKEDKSIVSDGERGGDERVGYEIDLGSGKPMTPEELAAALAPAPEVPMEPTLPEDPIEDTPPVVEDTVAASAEPLPTTPPSVEEKDDLLNSLLERLDRLEDKIDNVEHNVKDSRIIETLQDDVRNMADRLDNLSAAPQADTYAPEPIPAPSSAKNNAVQAEKRYVPRPVAQAPQPQEKPKPPLFGTLPHNTQWILKSAQPQEAYVIARGQMQGLIRIQPGDVLAGLGTIRAILMVDGLWALEGDQAYIIQDDTPQR